MESVAERGKLDKPESGAEALELTDKAGESMSAENVESADLCAERNPEDEEELGEEDDIEDEEVGEGEGEDEDEGRVFSVGEFVWGKIKHHPWWPGQIYDASDASDLAIKHKPKDKDLYLVAYFGDGTFSWCSGAQLKSFDDNFEYLSQQSSLKSFEYAVEDALSVIGELMVLEMTCACVKRDGQVGFVRPVVENAGVRKGVLVPMVGVDGLPVVRFDAAEIVSSVRNAARSISVKNSLELTMLSSKLLAFYHAKGYHELPKYQFPVYIDGLEDISKSSNDVDGLVSNEDCQTPLANSSEKARTLQGDKLYGRRKQKSLADIIREETNTDVLNDKEGKETPIRRRGTKKQKRVGQNDSEKKGNLSTLVKGKKKAKSSQKTNSCEDTKVEMADTTSADNNGRSDSLEIDVAVKSKGRKRMATMSGEKDGPAKSRDKKRKKDSLTPIASIKQAGFEPVLLDLRTDARVGERMSKAAKLIIESPSIRKHCSSIDPVATEMLPEPVTVSPLPETPIDSKLDVFSLKKASDLDTLMDEDDDDDDGRPMSAILFLTFSNGESLPSKTDLLAKYRQFGSLNEEETDVLPNSHCAQVVFIKKFEGEQAFEDMVKMNSADSGVHYRIRYVPRGSKAGKLDGSMLSKPSPKPGKVNNDAHAVSVSYLKQKFEAVMTKLNNVEEDELSDELKKELHSELTILLEKLN
ncbi:hypothetical protein QQ045_006438 [Rhodiola kirilowii]